MKRILVLASAVVLSLGASSVVQAQGDPFAGTWKLNVAKSKFTGYQPPKSYTRTVVAQGDSETVTYDGVASDGSPISYSYKTNLDGKDSPYSGTGAFGADSVALKRVDANTATGVAKTAGKTLYTVRLVVSKDGKVLTMTGKGANAQGQPISYTSVFDKQ